MVQLFQQRVRAAGKWLAVVLIMAFVGLDLRDSDQHVAKVVLAATSLASCGMLIAESVSVRWRRKKVFVLPDARCRAA